MTPENFLAILQGQADKVKGGTGRVLKSGPNDHVFVNFVDHGILQLAWHRPYASKVHLVSLLSQMQCCNQLI